MISSVFKTKKLVFVRKGTLFMTAETEAIKAQADFYLHNYTELLSSIDEL